MKGEKWPHEQWEMYANIPIPWILYGNSTGGGRGFLREDVPQIDLSTMNAGDFWFNQPVVFWGIFGYPPIGTPTCKAKKTTHTSRYFLNIFIPRCSMYDLFTYIWVVLGVNVGK